MTEELLNNLALVIRSSKNWVAFCTSQLHLEYHEIDRPSGNPPDLESVSKVLYMWRNVNSRNEKNMAEDLLRALKVAEQKNIMHVDEAVEALEKELRSVGQ